MEKNELVVSVVIPIYNEEKYIEKCLTSLDEQDFPKQDMEIILVDGGSTDKTLEIIKEYIKAKEKDYENRIKVLDNPRKTVQFALNLGIKEAIGKYIVRMDAHSEFASDYITKCIEYLKSTVGDNVGGSVVAVGNDKIQKVIAAAYSSKFAFGGGAFHNENYEGYGDTVFLGAFRRDYLLNMGLYDENFPINEDDELNFRIIESGGKIFVTSKIKSLYFPRNSYSKLFKQYYNYGYWKVDVIKKHKKAARISHLVPFAFVLFLFSSPFLLFFSLLRKLILAVLLVYILLNIAFSFSNKKIFGFLNKIRLIFVHFIMHFAYGLGFLVRLFQIFFRK